MLKNIFKEKGLNWKKVYRKIKGLIIKTFIAVEKGMQEKHRHTYVNRNTFYELYGFDILIDEKLKP